MLGPDRLNAFVFGGFAVVALAVSVVGVAGVLAFSVSARTREFGIRLAVGSQPRHLLTRVLGEGLLIAAVGIGVGALAGLGMAQIASSFIPNIALPRLWPIVGSIVSLLIAGAAASVLPATRAARIDVIGALRAE